MNISARLHALFLLALCCCAAAAEPDYVQLDGARLVALLGDPGSAQRAHYELWRRAEPKEDKGWIAFTQDHYAQRILACPQGPGRPPLTLVLYGYLSSYLQQDDYPVADLDRLFPDEPGGTTRAVCSPAIDAYAADGRQVNLFGGNNVLEARGTLVDLDGDGFIERIDTTRYSIEGVKSVEVVVVERVKEEGEQVFAAVINWGADEWKIEVVPPSADTPGEVRLGPPDAAGKVQSRAVIRPDLTSGWVLVGAPFKHVRQIDHRDIWAALKTCKSDNLAFSPDPAVGEAPEEGNTNIDGTAFKGRAIVPPAKPYVYQSLGTDPLVVAAFMDEGRSIRDLEAELKLKDAIPAALWTLPPREAALAFAEANRSPAHRLRFRLAVDARDGRQPPTELSLDLSWDSSRCYQDARSVWRLVVGPAGATLSMARIEQGGAVFTNPVTDLPAYDLRSLAIDPALARQVAETVWWLDRIRSLDRVGDEHGVSMSSSTADGRGLLLVGNGNGGPEFDLADTLWYDTVPERWRGAYGKEEALNLACLLLTRGLIEKLGLDWNVEQQKMAPDAHAVVADLLARWDARQRQDSNALILRAVEAVGHYAWADLDGELQRLAATLPQDLPPLRTREVIEVERAALGNDTVDQQKSTALYDGEFSLEQRQTHAPQALLAALALARAQIAAARDPAALEAWAQTNRAGWRWALSRLYALDLAAYVRVLEARLPGSAGYEARALFAAIAKADPACAQALAAAQPPAEAGALAVDAFATLKKSVAITDEGQRVQALLAVLLDPAQGWELRGQALELLVPSEQPLRYSSAEIDTALTALLDPAKADPTTNFTLGLACLALARRGRTAEVDAIIAVLERTTDTWARRDVLAAAVDLAQQVGGPAKERLGRWVAANLERSDMIITEVLWAAWVLDLRELAPVIDSIATGSAAGIEGPMVHSAGGEPRLVAEYRYHFARQIAQLWHEPDPAARAVLLLGLGYHDSQAWEDPARTRQRLAELTALRGDSAVRPAVAAWCAAWMQDQIQHYPASTIQLAKATAIVGVDLPAP